MKIDKRKDGNLTILEPHGRLDSQDGPVFEQTIEKTIESGSSSIVINMSEITYISSHGLRVILTGAKLAKAAGGRLAICSSQESVQKVFDITGVATLIGIYREYADAVDSFQSQPPV